MKCPLCGKELKDLLQHLITQHKLSGVDQLESEIQKKQRYNRRRCEFGKYVRELQERVKLGELTWEQYRELIMKWSNKHE